MEIKNIDTELSKAPLDRKAGIKLIKVTGDATLSVYAADISPNTFLRPHYHKMGIETYQILDGEGLMKIGKLSDERVIWVETFRAKKGDCFSIPAFAVHQIINQSTENLRAIFSCPSSHVGEDRYFVEEIQ